MLGSAGHWLRQLLQHTRRANLLPAKVCAAGHFGRYVGMVADVQILTPRGVQLSGTFVVPEDAQDAAVIFSHSFLCDRQSSPHFPRLAKMYRALGYATLVFDYSGHGLSDDDPLTADRRTEDFRAASAWLAEQGFTRQLAHAHSTGSLSALRAHPPAVKSFLVTSGALGGVTYDWEAIFAPEQLDQLDHNGFVEVPDDSPGPRRSFRVTSQTLVDLSLNRAEDLLKEVDTPLLLVYDRADEEAGLVTTATEAFPLLPDGSRLEVVEDVRFSDEVNLERLSELAMDWVRQRLPLDRAPARV